MYRFLRIHYSLHRHSRRNSHLLKALALAAFVSACSKEQVAEDANSNSESALPPPIDGEDSADWGNSDSNASGEDTSEEAGFNKNVDILLVVDNSGSMGEEQGLLAQALPKLVSALENPDVDANYRIAVTTSDGGRNFFGACGFQPADKIGNRGSFIDSSCLDRIDDFAYEGGSELDMSYAACRKNCSLTTEELAFQPSTTHQDPEAKIRPWIERIDGKTNLGEGVSAFDALSCLAPTGIVGCAFEMQLESQARALEKAYDEERPEFGFIRPDAQLVIIHLTDEADCSVDDESILDPQGDHSFWPHEGHLSSYICWAAGVDCSDDGQCSSQDYEASGNPTEIEDDAVLYPLTRYIDQLQGIKDVKDAHGSNNQVIVKLIGGVKGNGKSASVTYSDVSDTLPGFHDKFGVGPGCEFEYLVPKDPDLENESGNEAGEEEGEDPIHSEAQFAIPPVRIKEFSEHFTDSGLYSICQDDYSVVFEDLILRLKGEF